MTEIRTKRGDTLALALTETTGEPGALVPVDLTGYAIACQIRGSDDAIAATATVTITDATAGEYEVIVDASMMAGLLGLYSLDVQYTEPGGAVWSTETITLRVVPDVTR